MEPVIVELERQRSPVVVIAHQVSTICLVLDFVLFYVAYHGESRHIIDLAQEKAACRISQTDITDVSEGHININSPFVQTPM